MLRHEFEAKISGFYAFFNRDAPEGAVVDALYKQLGHLTAEALAAAMEHVQATTSRLTAGSNAAMLLREGFETWLASKPDRQVRESKPAGPCPENCRNGVLIYWRRLNGCWYEFAADCAHCNPLAPLHRKATRTQLEALGDAIMHPLDGKTFEVDPRLEHLRERRRHAA